jgi:hypothetical protein
MKTDGERYYRTTSLSLAIYLYVKSQKIAGINYSPDSKKKEFAFVQSPLLQELVNKYKFGDPDDEDLLVPVRLYEHGRNELLDRLNGN